MVYISSMRALVPALLFLSVLPALLSSCGGKPVDENDPAAMMSDAEEDIKSDHYQIALDKLRMIKNRFPYSKQSVDAQLRTADVYFLQEAYGEAALAYEAFKDLHPKHEKTAYAMHRMALSYYNDIPSTVARDMTSARKAIEAYESFLRRFPSATEAGDAQKKVAEIREKLAGKELYVGEFYFKRDLYKTAKQRFEKVVALFPGTEASAQAKLKLAACDKRISEGKSEEEDEKSSVIRKSGTSGMSSPLKPPSILGPGQ